MKIDILKKPDLSSAIARQISELYQQLGGDKNQVDLDAILEESNPIILAYCMDEGKVIGIASMCTYKVISGEKGWIEDVVVDASSRGKGIGRKLMDTLIHKGKALNLTEILLFTEAHRLPAIRLYTDLGFKVKESRIYHLKMKQEITNTAFSPSDNED